MAVGIHRLHRGARIQACYPIKPSAVPTLAQLHSAFQLQEYISLLIRLDPHDVERIVAVPEKGAAAEDVAIDEACWIYEQLRRLAQDLSHPLITVLQQECTRQTCPEMKAGEWLYLCVAHGNDGAMEQCCAIDYIIHTLDSATALLNSPRAFPSRLQIPPTSHRHFSSLARRLGRIFAHAFFHHRDAFEQAEAESSLYARFLALTARFALVPAEFLVIPARGDAEPDERGAGTLTHDEASESPQNPFASADDAPAAPASDDEPFAVEQTQAPAPPAHLRPANNGTDSPRRAGRSRTDTMVFSDSYNVVDELARAHAVPEPEPVSLGPAALAADEDPVADAVLEAATADEEEGEEGGADEHEEAEHAQDEAGEVEAALEAEPEEPTEAEPSGEAVLHDADEPASEPAPAAEDAPAKPSGAQCITLPDGTEVCMPPGQGPEFDFDLDEEPTPAPAATADDDDADEEDVKISVEAEGGAPVSADAVEEPLPTGSEAVVSTPAEDAPAEEKEAAEAADDDAVEEEEGTAPEKLETDVAAVLKDEKPSGLNAAAKEFVIGEGK